MNQKSIKRKKRKYTLPTFKQVIGAICLVAFLGYLGNTLEGHIGNQQDEWLIRGIIWTIFIFMILSIRKILHD